MLDRFGDKKFRERPFVYAIPLIRSVLESKIYFCQNLWRVFLLFNLVAGKHNALTGAPAGVLPA
jgi:hypothetical protein